MLDEPAAERKKLLEKAILELEKQTSQLATEIMEFSGETPLTSTRPVRFRMGTVRAPRALRGISMIWPHT